MRKPTLPLILLVALSMTACHQTQAKRGADTTASAATQKAGSPEAFHSPDQKKKEAIIKAQRQTLINGINDVIGAYQRKGIEIRKTPKKHPWRLIVPTLQQVSDPTTRKAQADAIANDFKTKVQAIMQHPIDVDVYTDTQETQKAN